MRKPPPLSAEEAAKAIERAEAAREEAKRRQAALEREGKEFCSVPQCTRKNDGGGYCSGHRMQVTRHGKITSPTIREYHHKPRTCRIKGCDRRAISRHLCSTHYMRYLRGNLNPSVPIRKRGNGEPKV